MQEWEIFYNITKQYKNFQYEKRIILKIDKMDVSMHRISTFTLDLNFKYQK